jgi:hypothetical protein
MKITSLNTFHTNDGQRNAIFLEIETEEDITGLGIDITVDELEKHPFRGTWHRGDKVNPDNSIAYI